MSRLPPLPPGPPPPRGGGDLYRPNTGRFDSFDYSHPSPAYPPPPGTGGRSQSTFHFQANMSHPPGSRDDPQRGGQPRRYDREPDRSFQDSYRPPKPPQGEFTFRTDAPRSIVTNGREMLLQPNPPRRAQNHASDRRGGYNSRGNRNAPPRGRGGFRGRAPMRAAERPMLQSNREPTPELMKGMDHDDNEAVKFRPVGDISDNDEADMELSSDNEGNPTTNGHESDHPRKKQARTAAYKPADGDSVPRWSNPDPYTALPPPDESGNKKDILDMIRKHKVVTSPEDTPKPQAAADEFISFDDEEDESSKSQQSGVSNSSHGNDMRGGARGPTFDQRNSPNSFSHRDSHQQRMNAATGSSSFSDFQKAGKARVELDKSSDPALGSRKRTFDDEIKHEQSREGRRPQFPMRKGQKGLTASAEGGIVPKWQFRGRNVEQPTPSPWCTVDHSRSSNMGIWLHKEIMDFYEHVKPRPFEEQIRTRLVTNLQRQIDRQFPDAEIRSFGSFPSGLYLPTADMDLVFLSKQFIGGGWPENTRKMLNKFRTFVLTNRLAVDGSIEVIAKAKVPLVKYLDSETNLKVDVSFENMTGIVAIDTFKAWKKQYPAMPIIVTLIKHFLAMRGLHEPVNGGIGGFSVTCLVTSLLQNLPSVQSGNLIPEHHLNEILMEFLNLYGNDFDTTKTAISLNPPEYIQKKISNQVYKQSNINRLSLIDPNNPDNDIAGGSKNIATIFDSFSKAFFDLAARMGQLNFAQLNDRRGQSILEVIIGGDYSSFETQRRHLAQMHERLSR